MHLRLTYFIPKRATFDLFKKKKGSLIQQSTTIKIKNMRKFLNGLYVSEEKELSKTKPL